MINLLKETLEDLKHAGKTPGDVSFVMIGLGEYEAKTPKFFLWEEFAALADFEYDNSFGSAEITRSLKIVGVDWWLERGEYDGSEWWEFKTMPERPPYCAPLKSDLVDKL